MPIQWFPGHMASARKKAAEAMAAIDVVIEVVDARLPAASSNPMIAQLRQFRNRPCLKLLNKADLADPDTLAGLVARFDGVATCALDRNSFTLLLERMETALWRDAAPAAWEHTHETTEE